MTAPPDLFHVGRERQAVVVIDDFAPDPAALRRAAAGAAFGPALHTYPGVRAALPEGYWRGQQEAVRSAAAAILGREVAIALIDASFSIVTTAREALSVPQRLPHCDAHAPDRIALVHYLTLGEDHGGTAFYHHRSTGFETIDAVRAPIYRDQLEAELRYRGPPAADYVGAEDRLFEQIAAIAPRYNRAVLYRSFALHSGVVGPGASLSADPATGRLTVTAFLDAADG